MIGVFLRRLVRRLRFARAAMMRVRIYGRWSNVAYHTWSALRSFAMFVRLWRLTRWHDRMMLLHDWEKLSPDERRHFGPLAGARLRRQLGVFRLALDGED